MKNYKLRGFVTLFIVIAAFLSTLTGLKKDAFAEVEWEVLEKIALDDTPNDIAISSDGRTAYILCTNNILIYSIQEKEVTDTIPIKAKFSQIALSADGEKLFLTDRKSKQLSIIKVVSIYDIEVGQSPVIGKLDAPVSIVAFLDYQCPYCARVYPVLGQLLEKYPKDVNLIIKHYPLRMHPFAKKASLAALAASKQNKYPEITKVLMSNYKNLNDKTIRKYAEEVGLDMKGFDKDCSDPSLRRIISQDMKLGAKMKVRGVPALFINGRGVKNRSFNTLSNMIESELKKHK